MKHNFYLQVAATLLCFLCGALANYCMLVMNLEGARSAIVSSVGFVCLPLGLFMAYSAYQERKSMERSYYGS